MEASPQLATVLLKLQFAPTSNELSCSPNGPELRNVAGAEGKVAEALQSWVPMPLPQQGRRKGQTEARL